DLHFEIGFRLAAQAASESKVEQTLAFLRLTRLVRRTTSRRDRSLAMALPLFLYCPLGDVHVLTATDDEAAEDAELYRAVSDQLGRDGGVGLLGPDSSPAQRQAAYAAGITVGAVDQFAADGATGYLGLVRATWNRFAFTDAYQRVLCLAEPRES